MSKTKGNVIDPIEIVKRFGPHAVRFTLAAMASPGTDIAFSEARTEGYRAFANKIWNAARFIFMNVDRAREAGIELDTAGLGAMPAVADDAPIEARWIVARLNHAAADVNRELGEYRFHEAANLVYQFFWGDFCDWYLEIVKLRLDFSEAADKEKTRAALAVLVGVFEAALRLLSPFMPFITEEIWHAVYDGRPPAKSIALTRFPQADAAGTASVEAEMTLVQELIVAVRAARKDLGVEEKAAVPIRMRTGAEAQRLFAANQDVVAKLARVSGVEFVAAAPEGSGVRSTPAFDVQVVYERTIDVAAERERLLKDLVRFEKEQANAQRQLANDAFLAKAPAQVVEGLRKRAGELVALIQKTRSALDGLSS
jgi:valyl-tRNA synthetase